MNYKSSLLNILKVRLMSQYMSLLGQQASRTQMNLFLSIVNQKRSPLVSPSQFNPQHLHFDPYSPHTWSYFDRSCVKCGLTAEEIVKSHDPQKLMVSCVFQREPKPLVPGPRMPDYHQAIIGWRGWNFNYDNRSRLILYPMGSGKPFYPWNQPWRAECVGSHGCKNPPERRCTCGFYATKNLDLILESLPYVVAKVEMWGKVIEHQDGYRAEKMFPVFFVISDVEVRHRTLQGTYNLGGQRYTALRPYGVPIYLMENLWQIKSMSSL